MVAIRPTHIAQIALPVQDLERAKNFYRERLGLTHLFDAPPGLSFFQCGETRLMMSRPEGAEAGSSVIYYAVASAREAHRALAGAGIDFLEDARCIAKVGGKDVWLAVGRDSEGNLFGLMSEED